MKPGTECEPHPFDSKPTPLAESPGHTSQLCMFSWGKCHPPAPPHSLCFLLGCENSLRQEGSLWRGETQCLRHQKGWGDTSPKDLALNTDPRGQAYPKRQRNPVPGYCKREGAWLSETVNLLPPPTQNLRTWKPNAERELLLPQQPLAYMFPLGSLLWYKDIHAQRSISKSAP